VCSAKNGDLLRSLGTDQVIDYNEVDFTQGRQRYDLVFDNAGNHSLSATRRALTAKGTLVMVGGVKMGNWLEPLVAPLQALVLSRFVSQNLVPFLAKRNQEDLGAIRDLLEAGQVTPVIDRQYPLSETPEAIRYLEAGHARGKIVITVQQGPADRLDHL
jgi:NADPH:quinone reductase-like Zn-dependent oxidoreductase